MKPNIDKSNAPEVEFDDNSLMPFGTFKDRRLEDVPAWHLLWLLNEDWLMSSTKPKYKKLKAYILDKEEALIKENEG